MTHAEPLPTGTPIGVLVVGAGTMGRPHALAFARHPRFSVVGVVNRGEEKRLALASELGGVPTFGDFDEALAATQPEAVCICTYPDTQVEYALAAFEAGAHVFVEKPMARDVAGAQKVVAAAQKAQRALLVGYILRVHEGWRRFVDCGRQLGTPLVMRFSLNQQSSGEHLRTHLKLMQSSSPVVDSGVHYVDVMCQLTSSRPVRVHAIGARLGGATPTNQFDYGQLQVTFADGSVGWFEAGWGPAMSRSAEFVRDIVGPRGSVSMVELPHRGGPALTIHRSDLDPHGQFAEPDECVALPDAPHLEDLCAAEQQLFLAAVLGKVDLRAHHQAAIDCLRIVAAADESMRTGRVIGLE